MHFETIYDIQQAGIKDPYVPFAGLFFAGGGWRYWLRCHTPEGAPKSGQPGTREAIGAMIFGGLFFVATAWVVWGQYVTLRYGQSHGQARTDEGVISNFHAATKPRDEDSFVLNGDTYSYGITRMKQGFAWQHRDGSPIADGLDVRVTHIGARILKLEVGRE